jgi:TfoX/Sxy family transcriptional regulator of competence genes
MGRDTELVDRVRAALAGRPSVREVRMFGGLAFMVDDRMVVCVRQDGDLLVRAAPERADELLALDGAGPAEMGAGRPMGRSWTSVGREALASDGQLAFWIGVALDHHAHGGRAATPARSRKRSG